MKKLILLASFAALAACSPGTSENADTAAAPESVAAEQVADTSPEIAPGVYDFTFANNWAPTVLTLNQDGAYTETGSGIPDKTGSWTQKDGKLCKTGDADECWIKKEKLESGAIVVTREGVTGTLSLRVQPVVAGTLAEARALPTGTYSQSCSEAKLDGIVMTATCATMDGRQVPTTLDLTNCPIGHNVMNNNGALACRVG